MTKIWQVQLFNGPVLLDASGTETRRFRSHKVGALLAYLALHLDRPCPREELYEALWPEEDPELVANRFRVTLASLRRQLEPDNIVFGSVLDVGEPGRVRLRAETVACDTVEFERLLRAGYSAEAALLITGPLLPGFYEDWAVAEQSRYELLHEDLITAPVAPRSRQGEGMRLLPEALSVPARTNSPVSSPLAVPYNPSLPLYLTRFFGREREQRTLSELLTAHRLVSLIGMGGIGKTRMATETARNWEGECLFVSLVPLPDAGRLYDTALQSLGVAPQADAPIDEQLIRVLRRRGTLLLILDNAEHLNDAVAAMALQLLTQVPDLRLLVTSRQRLGIAGETVLLVAPLEAPGPAARAERLLEFAAVSLFVDRAKNARPDFTLSERNAPAVAAICKRLEGIPLALELAAARITSQTPQQIALSLETGLTDLKARQRGLSQRHQSLRAVIQGSLDLLSDEQRTFFLALSVFQGGWSVEAAAAVTGCADFEEYLYHLTVCSLVVAREEERLGIMRYTLLETLRHFAAENLASEMQHAYRERHARFYIDMVARANQEDFRSMDRLEADQENLLLAMDWFWKHERHTLLPLLTDLLNLWANRGYHRLALDWIALAFPGDELIAAARLTERLVGYRVFVDVGRYDEAERVAQAVLQTARDPINKGWALTGISYVLMMKGEWDRAIAHQREALEYVVQAEEGRGSHALHMCYIHMGQTLNARAEYAADNPDPLEDFREAERYLYIGLEGLTEDSRLRSGNNRELMRSFWGQQRWEEGDLCFARALQIALAHRHLTSLIQTLGDGAFRLAAKGCPGESVQLISASVALQEKMEYRAPSYFASRIQKQLSALRNELGSEAFDRHWQSGVYTPLEVLIPSVFPQILLSKTV